MKLSIWLVSALFVWGAPFALIASLFTLPNAFWLLGVIVAFSFVGALLKCPVCGAWTTQHWTDGDGRGADAVYWRLPFAPARCGRCELDFRTHWFSGGDLPDHIAKWNARHVH